MSIISETHLCKQIPDTIVKVDGHNIYRRDRDWGSRDKRKNGGAAIFVRNHLKVLSVERNEAFEMISVKLLLPSGHHMLVVGAYHPPSFKYSECDLIDCIIELTDEFLDCSPDGVILCGGDFKPA